MQLNSVDRGDVVSVKTIDVNVTDGVDPVTPDAVTLVGNTLTIEVRDVATLIANMFEGRVIFDSGTFESETCLINTLRDEFI
jgi:hypothetical protein